MLVNLKARRLGVKHNLSRELSTPKESLPL
jgi:hypothetical protein